MKKIKSLSIIIPAKNEAAGLKVFLEELCQSYPHAEIILVNDGSTDDTASIAQSFDITVINHPYSLGNGAAIKSGARVASGDIFIFMDGDGQHPVADIALLLTKFAEGYDMVVGARSRATQANMVRWVGNSFGNYLASILVGQQVIDLTSGCRVVKSKKFKQFLHLLPNGFSYPSTITMAFFRSGYTVVYVPIKVRGRLGKSHLRPLTDGVKFLIILYKMTVLYSPLKVFIPIALLHFFLGLGNYAYTYFTQGRFTNMSGVLLSASVIIFLIGLVSEQITMLMYASKPEDTEN